MRALLITGVDGFVGRHLATIAHADGWEVFGVARSAAAAADIAPVLSGYASADLRVEWPATAPRDVPVIHLAGLAAVGPSFERPQDYLAGNSAMVTRMGEALLGAGPGARIIGVSSGAVYQVAPRGTAGCREDDMVAFTSPYVVSKILVENQLAYYRSRGLDTVTVRPFNHIGPGQGTGFLLPDLCARLQAIEKGGSLTVGNLDTRRDYTDVRDVARAYLALVAEPDLPHTTYNVASGRSRSGWEILEGLCAAMGREVPAVTVDSRFVRATDPREITGSIARIRRDVGWSPQISFEATVADVVRGHASPAA